MPQDVTEIKVAEDGTESHESWLLVRANHISSTPGAVLFQSDLQHERYIQVTISRCSRQRSLNRDRTFDTKVLMQFNLSVGDWGGFVSSFGSAAGVPATLDYFEGGVAQAPFQSRLAVSHEEVKNAGDKALSDIAAAEAAVQEAFENKLGAKVMRERLHTLHYAIKNAPANMKFAAASLTEHVEKVVSKARGDIESMARAEHESYAAAQLGQGMLNNMEIGSGEIEG